jgi:hypothetical protein
MYVGCSGATCAYMHVVYIEKNIYVWKNIFIFYLWDLEKGTSSLHGEMEKDLLSKFS